MPDDAPSHPGPAKVRNAPLTRRRRVELVATSDGRWRDLLDGADVMSEGGVVDEHEQRVYYGSTSLLVHAESAGGVLPDASLTDLAALLRHDPHVRVRAVRIAHREACARAGMPIAAIFAELDVRTMPKGVMLAVDVVAHGARGARDHRAVRGRSGR